MTLSRRSFWYWVALIFAFLAFVRAHAKEPTRTGKINVCYVGNSIQYFGDTPRLVENMFQTRYESVAQDSCLRPGASLVSVWDKGNGVADKFNTEAALREDGTYDIGAPTVQELLDDKGWDYVVLNDYTQAPARDKNRVRSLEALQRNYASAFPETATPIFLQTAAYRLEGINDSEDLGDFGEFTAKVREGCEKYVELLDDMNIQSRLAPVGEAYAVVREDNKELWEKLYSVDDFHPSPHGTWLQCCVLYCTMINKEPPSYDSSWWETARYMVETDPPLPLPTDDEAEELRQVAIRLCDITKTKVDERQEL